MPKSKIIQNKNKLPMTYDVMIIKQALVSFIIHLQRNDFLINVPFHGGQ